MRTMGKATATRAEQKLGRDTWIMWTGGNQNFFRLGSVTGGQPGDLGGILPAARLARPVVAVPAARAGERAELPRGDEARRVRPLARRMAGRRHLSRHRGLRPADGRRGPAEVPQPAVRPVEVGRRSTTSANPGSLEPPYLVGMSCGFCHMGFNPIRPPADPEHPRWENLAANLGNQFLHEGGVFFGDGRDRLRRRERRPRPGRRRRASPSGRDPAAGHVGDLAALL